MYVQRGVYFQRGHAGTALVQFDTGSEMGWGNVIVRLCSYSRHCRLAVIVTPYGACMLAHSPIFMCTVLIHLLVHSFIQPPAARCLIRSHGNK